MKKLLLLPAIMLIVFLVSFMPPDGWSTFTSGLGHYAISFPGNPSEHSENDTTENNVPFAIHTISYSRADTEIYILGWIDMTRFYPNDKNVLQVLDDARKGAVSSLQGTDVNIIKTNLESNPFIEFTFRSHGYTGKERIFIINKFQYSIITLGPSTGITPDMDRFISSFQHL